MILTMLVWLAVAPNAAFATRDTSDAACHARIRRDAVHLGVGDTATRVILAGLRRNRTGITIDSGASYRFSTSEQWLDSYIVAGAEGYSPSRARWYAVPLLWALQPVRRVPGARWFALIGEVPYGSRQFMTIDTGLVWRARATGELAAFANDFNGAYGNNRGCVALFVRRES
jgi:hypothetical protein